MSIDPSYRYSHRGRGVGARYDASHAVRVDAVIWSEFVKPFLKQVLAREFGGSPGGRYLDFACGTGRILKQAAPFFTTAVGLDISADMLEQAARRAPAADFLRIDVTREPTPSTLAEPFVCVTLFRFLLNAEPALRDEVLAWLSAHMEPGGLLIGNTHMHTFSIAGLVTVLAHMLPGKSPHHLSRRDVEQMLRNAGFEVERWEGFRVLPTLVGRPLLGHAIQRQAERLARRLGLGTFGAEQVFVARRL